MDAETDIWALGVVLNEMLAGRQPFGRGHTMAVLYAVQQTEPDPVALGVWIRPPISERSIDRALAKDPGSGIRPADEFLGDLEAVRDRGELGRQTAQYDRRRQLKRRKKDSLWNFCYGFDRRRRVGLVVAVPGCPPDRRPGRASLRQSFR